MSAVRQSRVRVVAAMLGAALLASSLLAGCGGTVIDDSKAEDSIQASLEESLREKITAVDCPSGQDVKAGTTFTCTVHFSNGEEKIATLKIRNKDADVSLVGLNPNK